MAKFRNQKKSGRKVPRHRMHTVSSRHTVSPSRQPSPNARSRARQSARRPSATRGTPTQGRESSRKQQQDAAMKIQSFMQPVLAIERGEKMAEFDSKFTNYNFGEEIMSDSERSRLRDKKKLDNQRALEKTHAELLELDELPDDENTPKSTIAQSGNTPDKGLIKEHENPEYSGVTRSIPAPATMSRTNLRHTRRNPVKKRRDNINREFFTVRDDGLGHKHTLDVPPPILLNPPNQEISSATRAKNRKLRKDVLHQRTTTNIESSPNPTNTKEITNDHSQAFLHPTELRTKKKDNTDTFQEETTNAWARTLRQRSARGNWDLAKNVIKAANAFQNRGKKGAGEQQTEGGTKKKKRRRSRKRRSRKRRTKRRR